MARAEMPPRVAMIILLGRSRENAHHVHRRKRQFARKMYHTCAVVLIFQSLQALWRDSSQGYTNI